MSDPLTAVVERLEKSDNALAAILRSISVLVAGQARPAQEWFSIDEVAAMTGLSDDHIRRHVASGLLPVSNQGTYDKPYYRIHRKDVEEWMAKRRETPSPPPRKKKPAKFVSRHHQNTS